MRTSGQRPKPVELKLLENNPGNHRIPIGVPDMPTADDCPSPPDFLSELARDEWARIAPGLHAIGLLSDVDIMALGAYCMAIGQWIEVELDIRRLAKNQRMKQTIDGMGLMVVLSKKSLLAAEKAIKFASEFGMTPIARARLGVDPGRKSKGGKFGGLLGQEAKTKEGK